MKKIDVAFELRHGEVIRMEPYAATAPYVVGMFPIPAPPSGLVGKVGETNDPCEPVALCLARRQENGMV